MSRRRTSSLGVDWFLPGRKRRFATTTVATKDLLVLLAEDDPDVTVFAAIGLINYDPDAIDILGHFVLAGYGETRLSELVG